MQQLSYRTLRVDAALEQAVWPLWTQQTSAAGVQRPILAHGQMPMHRRDTQRAGRLVSHNMRGFANASEPAQQSAAAAPAAAPVEESFVPPGRIQNAPAPPWTPTRELKKRNFLPRRMGHLMQVRTLLQAPDFDGWQQSCTWCLTPVAGAC